MIHVPYRGAPIITDLVSGDIQVGFGTLPAIEPALALGAMRMIAIAEGKRLSVVPGLPTISETMLAPRRAAKRLPVAAITAADGSSRTMAAGFPVERNEIGKCAARVDVDEPLSDANSPSRSDGSISG